jgi:hypothetical protein
LLLCPSSSLSCSIDKKLLLFEEQEAEDFTRGGDTTTETDQHSNNNDDDDLLQNQREGELKLPATHQQQADSIDFHEAKMEGAASTLSHGGASTDSLEYVYSPCDDDPILQQKKASPDDSAPRNGMEVLQSGDGVEVLMAFQKAHWPTRTLIEA